MNDPTPARAVLVERTDEDAELTRYAGAFILSKPSERTRIGYRIDLRQWFEWCRAWQLDPLDCKRSHVELWMRQMEDRELAPSTRGRKLAVVRSFYRWCVDEEVLIVNPADRVKRPPEDRTAQPAYGRTQMARLLEQAEAAGGYDHAIIMLLFVNGLRISEACATDISDLSTDRWHQVLTIMGKGAKPDTVPLPPPVMMAIHQALDGREVGPLLLNRYGNRANRMSATRTIGRLARRAGVPELTPHALRRTAIQLQLEDGRSLREVQLWARHAEPTTTARYDNRVRSMDNHPAYGVLRAIA